MRTLLLAGLLFMAGCSAPMPEPDGIVRFQVVLTADGMAGDVTATVREDGELRTVKKRVTPDDPWACGIDCSSAFWVCNDEGEAR